MTINQYEIWLADLNPTSGTEPGKTRPVAIVQSNLLNNEHTSTVICPITSQVNASIRLLRVHLPKRQLNKPSDILVDQIRAIDNRRLIKKIGCLTPDQQDTLQHNLRILLDLTSINDPN